MSTTYARAQERTLSEMHRSLFAPRFRANEDRGVAPAKDPLAFDVVADMRRTLAFHREKQIEVAATLSDLRASNAHTLVIDDAVNLLAHHGSEVSRLELELDAMGETVSQAAE